MFVLTPILDALRLLDAIRLKKPRAAIVTEKMQCKSYLKIIAYLWGRAVLVVIMCLIGGISLADIGFRPMAFNHNIWFTVITLVIGGLAFVYFIYELMASLASINFKEQIKEQYANDSQGDLSMLPRTGKEKRLYSLIAVSSAICEETVYRGFLLFLLLELFPGIPIFLIFSITFVTFGVAHLYKGMKGIIEAGLMAIVFMGLLIVTDSLIFVMLLHFIVNFSSTFMLSEEQGAGVAA